MRVTGAKRTRGVTARGAIDLQRYADCGGVSVGSAETTGRAFGGPGVLASPSPTSERSACSLIADPALGVSGERHYRDVGIVTYRARLASRIEVEAGASRNADPTT